MIKYVVPTDENTIKLYRGDSTKINEFVFGQTSKHCLVGQGIYLTNKESVADTYRTKGTWYFLREEPDVVLFIGYADNKEAAVRAAWPKFLDVMHVKEYGISYNKKSRAAGLFESRMQDQWYNMVHSKAIDISRCESKPGCGNPKWHFEITLRSTKHTSAGFITTFEFPKDMFNNNVYNVDGWHNDSGLIEILLPHMTAEAAEKYARYVGIHFSLGGLPKGSDFLLKMVIEGILNAPTTNGYDKYYQIKDKAWRRLRHILEPYGVIGFEYDGGSYVGGCGRHRAFCIWDDDFVNKHKVCRHK